MCVKGEVRLANEGVYLREKYYDTSYEIQTSSPVRGGSGYIETGKKVLKKKNSAVKRKSF